MSAKKNRESTPLPPTPEVSRSAPQRSIPLAKIRESLRRAGIQARHHRLLRCEPVVLRLIFVTLHHSMGSR